MRILIADDDITSRTVLSAVLQKNGHEVVEACDGTEALAVLEAADAPRMAILDWMMPGMDGPTLFRKMRETPEVQNLPVVFITAKASSAEMDELRAMGAAGAISKPFSPKDLPDQLRKIWSGLP